MQWREGCLTWKTSSPTLTVQTFSFADEGCLEAFSISATRNVFCRALASDTRHEQGQHRALVCVEHNTHQPADTYQRADTYLL